MVTRNRWIYRPETEHCLLVSRRQEGWARTDQAESEDVDVFACDFIVSVLHRR